VERDAIEKLSDNSKLQLQKVEVIEKNEVSPNKKKEIGLDSCKAAKRMRSHLINNFLTRDEIKHLSSCIQKHDEIREINKH
jgi:type I site-specific restriction endonuclease